MKKIRFEDCERFVKIMEEKEISDEKEFSRINVKELRSDDISKTLSSFNGKASLIEEAIRNKQFINEFLKEVILIFTRFGLQKTSILNWNQTVNYSFIVWILFKIGLVERPEDLKDSYSNEKVSSLLLSALAGRTIPFRHSEWEEMTTFNKLLTLSNLSYEEDFESLINFGILKMIFVLRIERNPDSELVKNEISIFALSGVANTLKFELNEEKIKPDYLLSSEDVIELRQVLKIYEMIYSLKKGMKDHSKIEGRISLSSYLKLKGEDIYSREDYKKLKKELEGFSDEDIEFISAYSIRGVPGFETTESLTAFIKAIKNNSYKKEISSKVEIVCSLWELLGYSSSEYMLLSEADKQQAIRRARGKFHPDREGGDEILFKKLMSLI